MLKKTMLLLPCFFLVLTLASFTIERPKAVRTIIIDPGHGGFDPGAKGLFSTEAQVSLILSKKLGLKLQEEIPGVKILFTRTEDVMAGHATNKKDGLKYRANFANQSKADLFISVHCNSAGKAPGGWHEKRIVDYTEQVSYTGKGKKRKKVVRKVPVYETVYVPNNAKGTETFIWTAKENSHKGENVEAHGEFASLDESSEEMPQDDAALNALKLIYTKKYFVKSLQLAELVQQEFEKSGRINRGVKQRNDVGIWVLHATGMPSVLVEAGFISNKEEEEYMNSAEGQDEIVRNITSAVKIYIASLDAPLTGKKDTDNEPEKSSVNSLVANLSDNRRKAISN
ncbi:MAG TPA: N-acetylmuramoyl-L-alanine amidase [Flavisolibacter sp.]|nr:N-acetylmuramoyl-L-alanine amidase [Flavisolibacter sp.]